MAMRIARLVAGYGAIVCALPYFALKMVWLSGGSLGVADPRVIHDTSMIVLNTVTAGMDLVGIGLALAFTHTWGLRVPAWLLLPPMWVATGLLVRFILVVPLTAIVALPAGASVRVSSGPVEPWVYALVYPGFVGLGLGLVTGFTLYAWRRWGDTLRLETRTWPPGPTHDVQVPLAAVAALMAIASTALHVAWVFGATIGLSAAAVARRSLASSILGGVDAVLTLGAAVGIVTIVRRGGDRRFLPPLALAWVGSGFLFAWSLWQLVNVLGRTALMTGAGAPVAPVIVHLDGLLRLLSGLVIGLVILVLLAERRAAAAAHQP